MALLHRAPATQTGLPGTDGATARASAVTGVLGAPGPLGGAGFLELWYIRVRRSSEMLPVSIEMRMIRLRRKALKKIAGTARNTPRSVMTRACEMSPARRLASTVPL